MEGASLKDKALGYVQQHPGVMLITIGVLFFIILVFYLQSSGYFGSGFTAGKGSKGKSSRSKSGDDDDNELDDLIDSIHKKQKKKKSSN